MKKMDAFKLYQRLKDCLSFDGAENLTTEYLKQVSDINVVDNDFRASGILHHVTINNHIPLLKLILEVRKDININICNIHQKTPLLLSLIHGHFDISMELIKGGCNVNQHGIFGDIPIHLAIKLKQLYIAKELILHNADINTQDLKGRTPLITLLRSNFHDFSELLNLLLEKGADVNICDKTKHSAMHYAVYYQNINTISTLLKYSPNLDLQDYHYNSALILLIQKYDNVELVKQIFKLKLQCNLELPDYEENRPLHHAVKRNSKEIVQEFIKNGANVNSRNYYFDTPLHLATTNLEISCMLLYYAAPVNALNYYKYSPVLNAIRLGQHKLATLMIDSYGGLKENRQNKMLFALLERPLEFREEDTVIEKVVSRFKNYLLTFRDYHAERYNFTNILKEWEGHYNYSLLLRYLQVILEFLLFLSPDNRWLTSYFFFGNYYSTLMWYAARSNLKLSEVMRIIWTSLSLGITTNKHEIANIIANVGLGCELEAVIWGSHSQDVLRDNCSGQICVKYKTYLSFLNSDIDSTTSKTLLMKIANFETERNLYKILNLFTVDLKDVSVLQTPKDHQLLANKIVQAAHVKSLVELSRNKVRECVKIKCKTTNFYQIHEIINNFNVPRRIKNFLQLKIPINCGKCRVMWCYCNTEETIRQLKVIKCADY